MKTVTSKDGTTIAFDQSGQGAALILVDGALEYRAMGSLNAQLTAHPLLTQHFRVIYFDRRGRGESGDTQPYALEREIEDIEALIDEAGGPAFLFGISSGAALVFEAGLALGGKVKKIALYEPPYNDDPAARQGWIAYRRKLDELVAEGRKTDALVHFMMLVGMPADQVSQARQHPLWSLWESAALTLPYDAAATGEDASVPVGRAAGLAVPVLVMDGGASYPFMHTTAVALAEAIPNAQHRTLEGQTHDVSADALAPVLVEFFSE